MKSKTIYKIVVENFTRAQQAGATEDSAWRNPRGISRDFSGGDAPESRERALWSREALEKGITFGYCEAQVFPQRSPEQR